MSVRQQTGPASTEAVSRRAIVAIACGAVVVAQMATTIYLPGMPALGADIGAGDGTMQLSVALFVVFAALPVVAWGRAAERFGRVPAFVAAGACFILASAALALITNAPQLLSLRVVQAIGAGGIAVVGRMMVKDLFTGAELARQLALLSMAFVVALGGGQVIGGIVTSTLGWRYGFAVLAALAVVPVGYALRVSFPPPGPKSESKGSARRLFGDRVFVAAAGAGGIGFAVIVMIQQKSAFIFSDGFALPPWVFGLFGALYGAAYLAGATYVRRGVSRLGARVMMRQGAWIMLAGCALITVVWAVELPRAVALPLFLAGYVTATFGQATLFPNSAAHAVSHLVAGGAMAVTWCALIQQGLAGIAALAGPALTGLLAWSIAITLLAAVNVLVVTVLSPTKE
ncbi:MFS transporter [Nocardia goodfellowii]|uniref:MFS family arabinose efflux permease n=1 Tax=Nocardia goodfellowii TaxID=882446 RepID=A0ABS4QBT9_9NOCA|nr:MFS transporter [Nocardia goodfellowii]MBP2189171.1 putative MFS family arabinose efflux permease [Nocardia goodfellowii]